MSETLETNATQESTTSPQVPDTTQGQDQSEPTLTQAEVDKIVGERAKRAKETARKEFLDSLGFDSEDGLKALLDDARKRQEAEMSEAEKALQQAETERQKREALEQQIANMQAQQIASSRESAFKDAVRKAGATDVSRLYILVNAEKSDDLTQLFADGSADFTASEMDKFVKQVQSDYSNYFASAGAGNPSQSSGTPPTSTEEAKRQAESVVSKKFGKL